MRIVVVAIVALCALVIGHSQQNASASMQRRPYAEVLELLMPKQPQHIPGASEWVAHLRVSEKGQPEVWIRVAKQYAERSKVAYMVEVRQLWPQPLARQLDEIQKKSRSMTIRDLAAKVSQRTWQMGDCPSAVALFDRLGKVSVPVIMDNTLVMDPPVYELSAIFNGGGIDINISGAEAPQDLRDLIRDSAAALLKCR